MVLSLKPFGACPPPSPTASSRRGEPVQGHDLPAGRDLRRGRDQRAQPRPDGARRGEGEGPRGDGAHPGADRAHAGRGARVRRGAPRLQDPLYKVPHAKGVIGTAATFVVHVDELMSRDAEATAAAPAGAGPEHGRARPRAALHRADVGSTTVKAVVVDPVADEVLWEDYEPRHQAAREVPRVPHRIETDFPPEGALPDLRHGLGRQRPAAHRRQVRAGGERRLAGRREALPRGRLGGGAGGQDAKIIIFKEDPETGKKTKIPSMNKCAGGTGAVIDKINAKLQIPPTSSATWATTASSCTRWRASAASSPRPTSTRSRRWACRRTSSWRPCSTRSWARTSPC